jgi:hypothetical protein
MVEKNGLKSKDHYSSDIFRSYGHLKVQTAILTTILAAILAAILDLTIEAKNVNS